MTAVGADLHEIVLSNSSFGPNEIRQVSRACAADYQQFTILRDAVQELELREDRSPAAAVRLGVCLYLLGQHQRALRTLESADGGALAQFYMGKCRLADGSYADAAKCFDAAKVAGYAADDCAVAKAEALRLAGKADDAMKLLDQLFGPIEQTAEYLYQRAATISALGSNPPEVIALYERAVNLPEQHPGALFGLALENDRHGNDELALDLYQRAANCFPSHVGALLNLGLMYEDQQRYDRAQICYQRVLDSHPTNYRARLFLRDTMASRNMVFDEDAQRRQDRLSQVLSVPVTDFELSVRSRNCLQRMGIRTLGDLTRTTEQDLLASKNFGETSLIEIREMLSSRGLELGQFAHERPETAAVPDVVAMSADEQALLDRPIADLNLSVRARKCMQRLGILTLGELLRKTGDDLLECKNFGVTSLNEVREKLTEIGMKLRGE